MFTIKEDSFNTSQDFLRRIQSVYSFIILPPMALTTVLFIIQVQQNIYGKGLPSYFLYSVLIIISVAMYFSYRFLWRGLSAIRPLKSEPLKTRMMMYYKVVSKQLFMIAVVAWFNGLLYAFTFEPYFLYIYIFVVLASSMEWPTKFRIVRHLRVNKEEKEILIKHLDVGQCV